MSSNGTHIMSFNIALTDMEERERGLLEICDMMRADLAEYPIIRTFQVTAGGQSGGMGGQSTVDVEIYGYDFAATDKVANDLTRIMKSYEGINEVVVSRDEYAGTSFKGLVSSYFNNSYLSAVSALVREEKITIDGLKQLIEQIEKGQ